MKLFKKKATKPAEVTPTPKAIDDWRKIGITATVKQGPSMMDQMMSHNRPERRNVKRESMDPEGSVDTTAAANRDQMGTSLRGTLVRVRSKCVTGNSPAPEDS